MKLKLLIVITLFTCIQQLFAQENYKTVSTVDSTKIYPGGTKYEVKTFIQNFRSKKPKNVIMMIGDGMGVSQVFAGATANGGRLFLDNFKCIGFSKTQAFDYYITDSAAGGTALSAGQ
jgi:alkaline phosphatase